MKLDEEPGRAFRPHRMAFLRRDNVGLTAGQQGLGSARGVPEMEAPRQHVDHPPNTWLRRVISEEGRRHCLLGELGRAGVRDDTGREL